MAGGLGFEPRQPESESGVLPLDDPPMAVGVGALALVSRGLINASPNGKPRMCRAPRGACASGRSVARRLWAAPRGGRGVPAAAAPGAEIGSAAPCGRGFPLSAAIPLGVRAVTVAQGKRAIDSACRRRAVCSIQECSRGEPAAVPGLETSGVASCALADHAFDSCWTTLPGGCRRPFGRAAARGADPVGPRTARSLKVPCR